MLLSDRRGKCATELTVDEPWGDEFPVRLFFDTECVFISSLLFLENMLHFVPALPFSAVVERPVAAVRRLRAVSRRSDAAPSESARVLPLSLLLLSCVHFPAALHHSENTSALTVFSFSLKEKWTTVARLGAQFNPGWNLRHLFWNWTKPVSLTEIKRFDLVASDSCVNRI